MAQKGEPTSTTTKAKKTASKTGTAVTATGQALPLDVIAVIIGFSASPALLLIRLGLASKRIFAELFHSFPLWDQISIRLGVRHLCVRLHRLRIAKHAENRKRTETPAAASAGPAPSSTPQAPTAEIQVVPTLVKRPPGISEKLYQPTSQKAFRKLKAWRKVCLEPEIAAANLRAHRCWSRILLHMREGPVRVDMAGQSGDLLIATRSYVEQRFSSYTGSWEEMNPIDSALLSTNPRHEVHTPARGSAPVLCPVPRHSLLGGRYICDREQKKMYHLPLGTVPVGNFNAWPASEVRGQGFLALDSSFESTYAWGAGKLVNVATGEEHGAAKDLKEPVRVHRRRALFTLERVIIDSNESPARRINTREIIRDQAFYPTDPDNQITLSDDAFLVRVSTESEKSKQKGERFLLIIPFDNYMNQQLLPDGDSVAISHAFVAATTKAGVAIYRREVSPSDPSTPIATIHPFFTPSSLSWVSSGRLAVCGPYFRIVVYDFLIPSWNPDIKALRVKVSNGATQAVSLSEANLFEDAAIALKEADLTEFTSIELSGPQAGVSSPQHRVLVLFSFHPQTLRNVLHPVAWKAEAAKLSRATTKLTSHQRHGKGGVPAKKPPPILPESVIIVGQKYTHKGWKCEDLAPANSKPIVEAVCHFIHSL